jgi:hypothetical protein
MPPQPPRPIPDNVYSRRLLEGGRDALNDIRNERRYGGVGTMADNPVSASTGYPSAKQYAANTTTSDLFDQWLAQVAPGTYQQTVGRGDGKYAGYQTQGMMEAATRGLANQYQKQGRAQFDALDQMAGQRLDDTASTYDAAVKAIPHGGGAILQTDNLSDLSSHYARMNAAQPKIAVAQDASGWSPVGAVKRAAASIQSIPEAQMVSESAAALESEEPDIRAYLNESLQPWYEQEAVPYMAQQLALQDMADQGRYAPYSVYGNQAAATLGIAPEIAAYWFDAEGDIAAANAQRAADIYEATGQTPEQYQAALDEMMKLGDEQYDADIDAQQVALEDGIADATGFDAGALAAASDLPMDGLYSVVSSEAFAEAVTAAREAISGNDPAALQQVVTDIAADPANDPLLRVLLAMYNDRLPNDPLLGG